MENSINLSILIPIFPLGMSIFIFTLLRAFNLTVNRLTKPISFLSLFAILGSTFLSFFYLSNHIEGQIYLSNYISIFKNTDLELHLNDLTEKIIILIGIINSLIILFAVSKLPRKKGYVLFVVNLGIITSILIFSSLLFEIHI